MQGRYFHTEALCRNGGRHDPYLSSFIIAILSQEQGMAEFRRPVAPLVMPDRAGNVESVLDRAAVDVAYERRGVTPPDVSKGGLPSSCSSWGAEEPHRSKVALIKKLALAEKITDLLTKRIKIGVTGFSRSGKTVYIGSIAQALLTSDAWNTRRGQGPLAHFGPFERGQFISARIRSDINSELPQFPFRQVRDSLIGKEAHWPAPTTGISRLILDCEYRSNSRFARGTRTIQLEIVDFPGEWLIDLPMLDLNYDEWSQRMLHLATKEGRTTWSRHYLDAIRSLGGNQLFNDDLVSDLSGLWGEYLHNAADNGYVLNQPGRMLRPDTMAHSPLLQLVPLGESSEGSPLYFTMANRYEEYKKKVIKPFYREQFATMDRQIVLVDLLRALRLGETRYQEMVDALAETLHSFQYSKGGPLSWLSGARTTHILFAATKADHVVRGDRENLKQMLERLLISVDHGKALRSSVLKYQVLPIASYQATEDRKTTVAPVREILYGRPKDETATNAYDPGGLPLDFPVQWDQVNFEFYEFSPLKERAADSLFEGFPSINIGRSLDFLIGDDFT